MTLTHEKYAGMTRREVELTMEMAPPTVVTRAIVDAGLLHIRDVAGGEEPYHYSSGNFGPGYVLIKGAVGYQKLFKFLVRQLALRLRDFREFDFIAGLVTGGVPPSLVLRDHLQELQDREIPWVYIRDARKAGGTREHITGIQHLSSGGVNPEIPEGARGLVVEELTNYANSLCNGAQVLRASGYTCEAGVSLLDIGQPESAQALGETDLHLRTLITLPTVLDALEQGQVFPLRLIQDYRSFQQSPADWMSRRGLVRRDHGR